jgi:hypothetical protein
MSSSIGIYCLSVGVLMMIWWSVSVRRGALRRPDRSRSEMALHLVAEMLTAILLVVSGVSLLTNGDSAVPIAALALGMLLYTVIASPGYFIARQELPPVYLFGALAMLTIAAAVGLVL